MNWLDLTLTVLDALSYFASLVRGTGMNSDLLPLAVIMLFAGGIVFWVLLTLAALNGIFRLVVRGTRTIVRSFPRRYASGGKITPREVKDDEVGPFILDPHAK